jgi:predicted hotdog family 3-hydroxylacyl-ACP dehydratase
MEKTNLSAVDISSIIPQKYPFVMVDSLLECSHLFTKTTFKIKTDNILVEDGEFSAAGLIENIAQTAAAGVGYKASQANVPTSGGYIGAIKNLEIFALPVVEDVIETSITVIDEVFSITLISGSVMCNGILLATCELKVFSDT